MQEGSVPWMHVIMSKQKATSLARPRKQIRKVTGTKFQFLH